MTKSLTQLKKQIAALEKQAEAVRAKEVKGVVARIKEAIAFYGLTVADLGLNGKSGALRPGRRAAAKPAVSVARYQDGSGNAWSGRGPRPKWLREALQAGKSLADFDTLTAPVKSAATKAKTRPGKRKASKAKFRDGSGHSWTGHGRQPQWFKDAIASGLKPEQLAV